MRVRESAGSACLASPERGGTERSEAVGLVTDNITDTLLHTILKFRATKEQLRTNEITGSCRPCRPGNSGLCPPSFRLVLSEPASEYAALKYGYYDKEYIRYCNEQKRWHQRPREHHAAFFAF